MRVLLVALPALSVAVTAPETLARDFTETPSLAAAVTAGELPPVEERLPSRPLVVRFETGSAAIGRHGGELQTLIRKAKDVKFVSVYGYARLVGYTREYEIAPDLLEDLEVEDGRRFTFKLRPGHKWSDGQPFTAEDFRYWWEDVANNAKLSPSGPPQIMLVEGEPPQFEVLDEVTVRFTWAKPNPMLLQRLVSASPLFPYLPAHYMKQFHVRYADPKQLAKAVESTGVLDWAQLHDRRDNLFFSNNPDLPTLQPWVNRTEGPSTRFIAERNPFFHRVDQEGRQLPYLDRLIFNVVSPDLMAFKTAAGDSDLQARGLTLADYTILKENEANGGYRTLLWRPGTGAQIALYPNLNVKDPVWRALMQDVRFRRALSLGINRGAINQILYFGLAQESNNTLLSESPLSRESYRTSWAVHDPTQAAALLDDIGLTQRDSEGTRLLPDGRPLEIIVETAGEQPEQVDVLELVTSDWAALGVKLLIRPRQREVLRKRAFSGEAQMSVWSGLNNAVATPDMSPGELAPTSQFALQWPRWGAYVESGGRTGEAPDMPVPRKLVELYKRWLAATDSAEREAVWQEMLSANADNVFSFGIVTGVPQPVAVKSGLMNLPEQGIYAWDPGAVFGVYRPDTFWWR